MWNFCTMTPTDLFTHVFRIYGASCVTSPHVHHIDKLTCFFVDDDHNGTLDAAECDSLFRLLYHTDELSDDIKRVLQSVDANGDGLLSLSTYRLRLAPYLQ